MSLIPGKRYRCTNKKENKECFTGIFTKTYDRSRGHTIGFQFRRDDGKRDNATSDGSGDWRINSEEYTYELLDGECELLSTLKNDIRENRFYLYAMLMVYIVFKMFRRKRGNR